MSWTAPDPGPSAGLLTGGPMTGDERAVLQGYLDRHRATLLRICAGLTAEELAARPVPPSTLSLLGLVRHLAKVERIWLRRRVGGEDVPDLHGGPGDPTDFDAGVAELAADELRVLQEEAARGDAAVAGIPLDHEIDFRGEAMSLRMVYLHLIGEYARHNGHADLLRQVIDGVVGR
ncbi:DinB family protein [Pseudonocardia ailaonensis]|uniref:DinB family protein n=1 Tax=Pseudonocardia ailaonensis TaxID=367279 RepID=UPI0031D57FEF